MEQSDLPRLLVLLNCQNDFATPEFPYYKKLLCDTHRKDILKLLETVFYDDVLVLIDLHSKEEFQRKQIKHCIFNSEGAMIFTPLLQYLKANFKTRAFIKNEFRHIRDNNNFKTHLSNFNPKVTTIDYCGFEHYKNEFEDVHNYFRNFGYKTDKQVIMNVSNKEN